MTRPQPARQPEYLRRYGWDSDMDQSPLAQITSCQRFISSDGRRDWLLLHVAPNHRGVPSRLMTTNLYGEEWGEPSADGFWSDDDGFVVASAWDVSSYPTYAEPGATCPMPAAPPWSTYAVHYASSGPRPATVVRDAALMVCVALLLPLFAVIAARDRWRERRRGIKVVWLSSPPPPTGPASPTDDDDLALLGALRSEKESLVARAVLRGTVIIPASSTGSTTADARPLRVRTSVGSDGLTRLHVFSTVSSMIRGSDSVDAAYDVVAGISLAAVAEQEGASIVSLDDGRAHHLEVSTSDLHAHAARLSPAPPTAP